MKWRVRTLNARVDAELQSLRPELKARFLHICSLLEEYGLHAVGAPHVRHLVGKLWEMRMRDVQGIARAIYVTRQGRVIVVVHVFEKKSQKTPRSAIELAVTRLKEFEDD